MNARSSSGILLCVGASGARPRSTRCPSRRTRQPGIAQWLVPEEVRLSWEARIPTREPLRILTIRVTIDRGYSRDVRIQLRIVPGLVGLRSRKSHCVIARILDRTAVGSLDLPGGVADHVTEAGVYLYFGSRRVDQDRRN